MFIHGLPCNPELSSRQIANFLRVLPDVFNYVVPILYAMLDAPGVGRLLVDPHAVEELAALVRSSSGSSVQSQEISRCCSELIAAHSSRRATCHAARAVTGAGDLPKSASRMPS